MEKDYSKLPIESQIEILSHTPYMRRITKNYNLQGNQLFFERYCNMDINKEEFITYLKNNIPPKFMTIFTNKNDSYYIEIIELQDEFYTILGIDIAINEDKNGVKFMPDRGLLWYDFYELDTSYTLSEIIDRINNVEYLYYDIETVYNIAKTRVCEEIKPGYSKFYVSNYINNIISQSLSNNIRFENFKDFTILFNIIFLVEFYDYDLDTDDIEDFLKPLMRYIDNNDIENLNITYNIYYERLQHIINNIDRPESY